MNIYEAAILLSQQPKLTVTKASEAVGKFNKSADCESRHWQYLATPSSDPRV